MQYVQKQNCGPVCAWCAYHANQHWSPNLQSPPFPNSFKWCWRGRLSQSSIKRQLFRAFTVCPRLLILEMLAFYGRSLLQPTVTPCDVTQKKQVMQVKIPVSLSKRRYDSYSFTDWGLRGLMLTFAFLFLLLVHFLCSAGTGAMSESLSIQCVTRSVPISYKRPAIKYMLNWSRRIQNHRNSHVYISLWQHTSTLMCNKSGGTCSPQQDRARNTESMHWQRPTLAWPTECMHIKCS